MKFRMLLSALLLAAGLVCVAGCGKKAAANKKNEEKPVDDKQAAIAAFNEFKGAIVKGDAAAAKAVTAKDSAEFVDFMIMAVKEDAKSKAEFEKIEIINCEVKGDKATLKVKDANGKESEVKMVKEDGKWKLALK